MQRRQFVKMLTASLVVMQTPAFASTLKNNKKPSKIVWIIQRGGMDSLHTLVPTFDPDYSRLRPKLSRSINDKLLMLDQGFGLHPALTHMHQLYKQKQLLPIVAVGSGYGRRSHFDGQDYLESGLTTMDHDNGWLGRAVDIKQKDAIAIANSLPISLRNSKASTWYPSNLKDADADIYESLLGLYQDDELLRSRLEQGLKVQVMAGTSTNKRNGKFVSLARSCAKLLASDNGTDCAMLEIGGWDTHNNQIGRLDRQLQELDQGLAALRTGLGDYWQNTVVIVATEFGRTAKENGTGGTDHGTGSAMFLAGGAVKGGQVLGQWPGLADAQLFQQRDLMPTTGVFSWLATVLAQHWQLTDKQLAEIFPDSKSYQQQLIV